MLRLARDLGQYASVDLESIHFEKARINIQWLHLYKEKLTLYLKNEKKKKL